MCLELMSLKQPANGCIILYIGQYYIVIQRPRVHCLLLLLLLLCKPHAEYTTQIIIQSLCMLYCGFSNVPVTYSCGVCCCTVFMASHRSLVG